MKNKFLQTLIAIVIELILILIFGVISFFTLSSDEFFAEPFLITIPLLIAAQAINFIILYFLFRKEDK